MIVRNQLKTRKAFPATIVKLERHEGIVLRVFEVPIVKLCILRRLEKTSGWHPVSIVSIRALFSALQRGRCNSHNPVSFLILEVGGFRQSSLPAPCAEHHDLNQPSVICSRSLFLFLARKHERPGFCSHVPEDRALVFVIPSLVRLKESSHDLTTGS